MKKVLYITCSSKPENLSASKTVAKHFLTEWLACHKELEVEELNLYNMDVPQLKDCYLDGRCSLVTGSDYEKLSNEEKQCIEQIKSLAEQFKAADHYVIVAPLWNMKFPGPLSDYIDCININDITLTIAPDKIAGRLDDKNRIAVYVQASGGAVTPGKPCTQINHGGNYLKDVLSFMGIKTYHQVLVENTGFTAQEQHQAVEKGKQEAKELATKLCSC